MCANCSTDGFETFIHPETGVLLHKVEINLPDTIQVMKSLTSLDGNMGDGIPMPSLGPNVVVRSRQDMKDALRRARDEYYKATDGEHVSHVPTEQPDGSFVMEKVTQQRQGVDIGEIVPVADLADHLNPPEDKKTGQFYQEVALESRRQKGEVSEHTEPDIFTKRVDTPDPAGELVNPFKKKPGRPTKAKVK